MPRTDTHRQQPTALLRRSLGANALFSALSAAVLVSRANRLADHLALSTGDLVALGAQLGVFAALLLLLATRPRLGRIWTQIAAALVVLADAGWALGSLGALAGGIAWTGAGTALVLTGAIVTGTLAALQTIGILRIRRTGEAAREVPRRPLGARVKRAIALAATTLGLFVLLYLLLPWADLRAETVRRPDPAEASAAAGRELLEAVARAHGVEAFAALRTMEIVAVDEWAGDSAWWPEPAQRFRAERLLGTFTSRVELLDGPEAGRVRGIQSWTPYRRESTGAPLERPHTDPMITFYLPTLQYFDELPFRLLEATVALDAGEATVGGRAYRRLFVTWNDPAPHAAVDQYELLVDPETLLIAKVSYTVRDGAATSPAWMRPLMRIAAVGTMHYEDYREIDGVMMAFRQTVTLGSAEATPETLEESFFHRLLVESVRFDTVAPGALLPIDGLPEPGDRKPL